jgi:hypothetical protein
MRKTRIPLVAALPLFALAAGPLDTAGPAARTTAERSDNPARVDAASAMVEKPDPHVRQAVQALLTTADFPRLCALPEHWKATLPERSRKQLLTALLHGLHSARELRLDNYADLFIPSRGAAGKMAFHGHGYLVDQDLFLEAGRCAWAIEQFGSVRLPTFTEEVLQNPNQLREHIRAAERQVTGATGGR